MLLALSCCINITRTGIISKPTQAGVQISAQQPDQPQKLQTNTNPATLQEAAKVEGTLSNSPQKTEPLDNNNQSLEIKTSATPKKEESNVQGNSVALKQKEENKLSRKLYIAKRKYKRKMVIPGELGSKDKRDLKGFLRNRKSKKALKAYKKNPATGLKRLSRTQNLKKKLKKNLGKLDKYQYNMGALNNVYNMTANVFPISNHLQKYDDIAETYKIIAHNYELFGSKNKEDQFQKDFLYGTVKPKIGNTPDHFINTRLRGNDTKMYFPKPMYSRTRLKNENVPDEKKTLAQMEAKIKVREKKLAAFRKKQKAKRNRMMRGGGGRRRGRRMPKRRGKKRRGRKRRRKLSLVRRKGSVLARRLGLRNAESEPKKSEQGLDLIDQLLSGSIKHDETKGNISDMEFEEKLMEDN